MQQFYELDRRHANVLFGKRVAMTLLQNLLLTIDANKYTVTVNIKMKRRNDI